MKKTFLLGIFTAFIILMGTQIAHAVELKISTLAPEGTTMYNGLHETARQIKERTGGRVTVKIYAGGIQGDEKDVVRKIRYGQLDGAALTGVGLGLIDPQIRVLELPFLFRNTADVDRVYSQLDDYFKQQFAAKGFQLLGWAEVGFVKLFSNKPIRNKKDLEGMKMWMWEGDPLAEAMYRAMQVTPIPLAITDVLTSLQTHLIDAAYAPELGAIAFQWHTKTKYMTDVNLVNGTGGIVLSKKAWAKLAPADRNTIQQIIKSEAKKLVQQTRQDNLKSKEAIQSFGIQVVELEPKALEELMVIGQQVRTELTGRLYSQELLNRVLGILN